MRQVDSPWLAGVDNAALYAGIGKDDMRVLVKSGIVTSRLKPKRADGTRPRGLLVYAPSIDELILQQPSGAAQVAQALRSATS